MLLDLKVSNFAIIDEVSVHFKPGLNILSGETGAGKSIIMKSLALLMGDKADSRAVRQGSEHATIEGLFDLGDRKDIIERLKALDIDVTEETLVVRRTVSSNGKNRVYLNDTLTSLNSLRDIVAPLIEVTGPGSPLIEITSQHENKNLASKLYQLDLLDTYAKTWALRHEVQKSYEELQETREKLNKVMGQLQWREQRLDFLKFQREEIKNFSPAPEDDDGLEAQIRKARNSSQLIEFRTMAEDTLYENEQSVLSAIHKLEQRQIYFQKIDPSISEIFKPLEAAKANLNEFLFAIREYGQSLDVDTNQLDVMEKRLSDFRLLQKKYGQTTNEILAHLNKIETEINELENANESIDALQREVSDRTAKLDKLAKKLHAERESSSKSLVKEVNSELSGLNMKGLSVALVFEDLPEVTSHGISDVEFVTKISKTSTPLPLAKFASGGELSRILLALKCVTGHDGKPRTYLFDEVDAGVSGETAEKVGIKLQQISKKQQVICITHLPQVAAQGNVHFYVNKKVSSGKAKMEISELSGKSRVQEVARLISGEKITKTSLAHAESLLTH
ncbi:MAG: hypothetical protein A4S09_15990 [Proteobacteria bacterium SG_bin7]|nr:MAG: hypothetical protein A4S09_15990 [Proteobacteria bacterium SG_bin7]